MAFIGVMNAFRRSLNHPWWDPGKGYDDDSCWALELAAVVQRPSERNGRFSRSPCSVQHVDVVNATRAAVGRCCQCVVVTPVSVRAREMI